jgi:hypothetical protein
MEGSHMGQVRHGSATTTHAVRAAIQRSQASLTALSRELFEFGKSKFPCFSDNAVRTCRDWLADHAIQEAWAAYSARNNA